MPIKAASAVPWGGLVGGIAARVCVTLSQPHGHRLCRGMGVARGRGCSRGRCGRSVDGRVFGYRYDVGCMVWAGSAGSAGRVAIGGSAVHAGRIWGMPMGVGVPNPLSPYASPYSMPLPPGARRATKRPGCSGLLGWGLEVGRIQVAITGGGAAMGQDGAQPAARRGDCPKVEQAPACKTYAWQWNRRARGGCGKDFAGDAALDLLFSSAMMVRGREEGNTTR